LQVTPETETDQLLRVKGLTTVGFDDHRGTDLINRLGVFIEKEGDDEGYDNGQYEKIPIAVNLKKEGFIIKTLFSLSLGLLIITVNIVFHLINYLLK
jgi:hypothetical protein